MLAYNLLLEKIAAYQSDKTDERVREQLKNEIVAENEGICVLKAEKFKDSGVEWDDLLNEARQGIGETIKRFDLDRGNKFSTYACYWINKNLQLVVANHRMIYLPDSAQRVARKAQKIIDEGVSDVLEIADRIEKASDYVQDCIEMSHTVQRIPVNDDGVEMEFAASTDEDSEETPIQAALAKLPPDVADLCIKRQCGWKFPELAKYFQCSVKRVRQLYKEALETLRQLLTSEAPETPNEQPLPQNPFNLRILSDRTAFNPEFYKPVTSLFSSALDRVLAFLQPLQKAETSELGSDQAVLSELDGTVTEQMPQVATSRAIELLQVSAFLRQELFREPSIEEISFFLSVIPYLKLGALYMLKTTLSALSLLVLTALPVLANPASNAS